HRTAVDSCQAGCPWYRGPRRRAMAGGHSHLRRREERAGMLFAAPWILGFVLFTLGPMLMSLYLGFTQYSIASPPKWIGLANFVKAFSGADRLFWPSLGRTALYAGVMVAFWGAVGGATMVIFLAGLQGVPVELQEAAQIDGASALQRFWAITVPMITPTLFFNLVLGVIAALRTFAPALVATNGGPDYATW